MFRGILATVGGLVAAAIVLMIFQKVGHWIYPMPAGLDVKNKEAMGAWISQLPLGAFLLLLAGYAVGSLAGGATAALIGGTLRPALVTGGVLMLMGIANLLMIPHPIWLAVTSLALYLPLAWLGAKMMLKS
ncbi:MAG TPA: hypothetical protein VK661_02500 [Planctomycetota bacterium]|nr:hypothetical protein [Planctomycetota bacterium]